MALETQQQLSAAIVGFPRNVTLRVGDFVTVTDGHPGYALAALPVCTWFTGSPKESTSGIVEISGISALTSPTSTPPRGQAVSICLLDTSLPERQILGIRSGS